MKIEHATITDAPFLVELEAACFPKTEAATPSQIKDRLQAYPECFWLTKDNGKIVAALNGMATNEPDLADEMFADATMHHFDGAWQMIFSVATCPERRGEGLAEMLIKRMIADSKTRGRKGSVLTCKDHLIDFYSRFGFVDEGICTSEHGGVAWHQMRLSF
jgi:predicted GNAT family N-acyltransferase